MVNETITLAELAERSGVELRTLRSWIQQGLLPGPENVGRNARYASAALTRARAVKVMRDLYGLPLSTIRQDLLTSDDDRIAAYAAMADGGPAPAERDLPSTIAPAPLGSTAADYLRSLRSSGVFGGEPRKVEPQAPAGPAQLSTAGSRLARLADGLEHIAGSHPSRRKAKGDVRLHIAITPEIELIVRGQQTPEEIARFEQVADLLRIILSGATDND
jgi:DNA-binding transcriptional MerR regulator